MDKRSAIFKSINPVKAILLLAIPTVLSQLIYVFYNLADTFFLGRTGNPYMIASTGIAVGLYAIGIVISNLFGIGGGSLLARLLGVNKKSRLRNISSFSFYLSIISSIIYSLIIFLAMKPILYLLGASDLTYEYCRQYTLIVVVFGTPIMCASNTLAHLLRNVGLSKQAGIGLSLGGLLNIGLDPLFMFVLFSKESEVKAAGVATLISSIIALIYLITVYLLNNKKTQLSINPKLSLDINKEEVISILKIGIPSALLLLFFIISQMITISVMANYSDLQVSAIGIVIKIEKIASAIGVGICQGMLPIVAFNYSCKNKDRMNDVIKSGLIIGIIATSICSILFFFLSDQLASLFLMGSSGDVSKTIEYTSKYLKIRSLVSLLMFFNYFASYNLQAINNGRETFIHAVIRTVVVYIPLIFLFNFLYKDIGLAVSFEVSEFIAGVVGIILLMINLKKYNQSLNKNKLKNLDC